MTEKILTLHPAGKQGVNIDKGKYDTVREAIEETLRAQPGITFSALTEEVGRGFGKLVCGICETGSGGAGCVGAGRWAQSAAVAVGGVGECDGNR